MAAVQLGPRSNGAYVDSVQSDTHRSWAVRDHVRRPHVPGLSAVLGRTLPRQHDVRVRGCWGRAFENRVGQPQATQGRDFVRLLGQGQVFVSCKEEQDVPQDVPQKEGPKTA